MSGMLRESGVTEPIATRTGSKSDHKTVYAFFDMPRVPQYKIEKYTYTIQTPEGDEEMKAYLNQASFAEVVEEEHPSKKVDKLHEIFEYGMNKFYKTVSKSKKTLNHLGPETAFVV